jgi:hypothetical protein
VAEPEAPKLARTQVALILCAVVVAVSVGVGSLFLVERFHDTNARRKVQRDFNARILASQRRQTDTIKAVLCFAEQQSLHNRASTTEQKARALEFYSAVLRTVLHVKPCKLTRPEVPH